MTETLSSKPLGAPVCPWHEAAHQWPERAAFILANGEKVTWAALHSNILNAQREIAAMDSPVLAYVVSNTEQDAVMLAASLREGRDLMLFGRRLPEAELHQQCEDHQAALVTELPQTKLPDARSSGPSESILTGATRIRTSGSTGDARWVRHNAAAHLASARAIVRRLELSHEDRWGWCLPSNHVGGLSILWRNALVGAATVAMHQGGMLSDWLRGLPDAESPSVLSLVPTQLKDLVASDTEPPTSLHSVIVGGAALSGNLLSGALERGWPIRTTYGMTETASMVTLSDVWLREDHPAGGEKPIHSGKPLVHATLSIKSGRIYIKTEAAGDDLAGPDGWITSSDHGKEDEMGRWVIGGRLDRVIISGGENLDPARIESAIHALSNVDEVRVVGIPDARYGQRPVAFIESAESVPHRTWFVDALQSELASFEIPDLFLPMPHADSGDAKLSSAHLIAVAVAHSSGAGNQA